MQTMSRFNVWVTFFRPTHTPNVRRYLRYVLFSRQSNPIPNPNPSVARSPRVHHITSIHARPPVFRNLSMQSFLPRESGIENFNTTGTVGRISVLLHTSV